MRNSKERNIKRKMSFNSKVWFWKNFCEILPEKNFNYKNFCDKESNRVINIRSTRKFDFAKFLRQWIRKSGISKEKCRSIRKILILEKSLRNLTAEESQLLQKFLRQRITFESNNKHGLTRKFLTRFCKIFAMNSKGWNPWEESSKGKHRSAMNSKVWFWKNLCEILPQKNLNYKNFCDKESNRIINIRSTRKFDFAKFLRQ